MSYDKIKRAEDRLSRNLNNIFWAFATFTSFHLGFLYLVAKEMPVFEIPRNIIGIISITGGTILYFASIMSMNTYRTKLKANESVIKTLEEEFDDYQQKIEIEWPKPILYGAEKSRKIILFYLWVSEILIGIFFLITNKP